MRRCWRIGYFLAQSIALQPACVVLLEIHPCNQRQLATRPRGLAQLSPRRQKMSRREGAALSLLIQTQGWFHSLGTCFLRKAEIFAPQPIEKGTRCSQGNLSHLKERRDALVKTPHPSLCLGLTVDRGDKLFNSTASLVSCQFIDSFVGCRLATFLIPT